MQENKDFANSNISYTIIQIKHVIIHVYGAIIDWLVISAPQAHIAVENWGMKQFSGLQLMEYCINAAYR